ncbi:hypothetical protein GCM10009530_69600 [Microbispora corallina]|uniref:Glycosyltransferase n=1 Tax=Microbispora corallina TaxID=83302 RepID=A0ABQ4G385_9ACTN|nr:glycosyltransferase family 4 protein [Microbispora corallina]GIH41511.1 hypothetical protein Mco01_45110 [Microbispora corallina]
MEPSEDGTAREGGRMTVRYLLMNAYSVGGTIRTVINQANAMAAAGHDVDLVSVFRTRQETRFPVDPRVRLRSLADLRGPEWRHPLRTWLVRRPSTLVPPAEVRYTTFNRFSDPRIVAYLQTLHGGVLVTTRPALNLLAARFAPRDVVLVGQEHMHLDSHKAGLRAEIERWYPRLDALVALTETDAARYGALLAGSDAAVVAIPNGLTPAERRPADVDGTTVVAVGRLTPQKGFDMLITAFAAVAAAHPEWRLRIYGDGRERARLLRLAGRLGLRDRVFLMGTTMKIEKELAKGSLFVLSSRSEGFGMVLIEAMAHGLPVVSFDCPEGPAEIVTPERDGLLVPPKDVDALAAAITRLVEDPALRASLGAAARASSARYGMDVVHARWEALFARLLTARENAGIQGGTLGKAANR